MKIKQILGLSIISSSLLLSSTYSDTEMMLKKAYDKDFTCSIEGCSGNDFIFDEGGAKTTIKKMTLKFSGKKDLTLIYNKDKIKDILNKECSTDSLCITNKKEEIFREELRNILSQSKDIVLDNVKSVNKKTNEITTIDKVAIGLDDAMINFNPLDMTDLKIKNLLFKTRVNIEGIKTSKEIDILKYIVGSLPKYKEQVINSSTGKMSIVENKTIKSINFKYIKMYSEIIKKIDSKNISNIVVDFQSKKIKKDLKISINGTLDNTIIAKTNIGISVTVKDVLKSIKGIDSQSNPMMLLMTLGSKIIINKVSLENQQDTFFNIHNNLLTTDKNYKRNHEELLTLLEENKSEFSFYNNFQYKLLSLKYKDGSISVKNKNKLPIMQLIGEIENKDSFKIKESFK